MPHLSPAQRNDEHREMGAAVQHASECLPVGWELWLIVENNNAEVRLYDPQDEQEYYTPTGGHLGDEIRAAVEHARGCENMPAVNHRAERRKRARR